jgi:hypothetical protein
MWEEFVVIEKPVSDSPGDYRPKNKEYYKQCGEVHGEG